uniref:Cortactin-binding protein 2 n=1 Tax=Scophthalmus maximus TaxID=52904 RepID=A0A8D3B953_SCOMX
ELKCEFNMDNLSKPELLTLLSIMEGELEARDLVIEALRAQRKEVFLQERYGHYSLTDPFLALQRDFECGVPGGAAERRPMGSSPISVLEAVMAHCRKMQERMSAQLAAAESRQKRLEMEKLQLQSLEQEHRKLTAQLKDEREKNKHIVMMLVRECKQLATRVVEESQRFDDLQARLDEESRTSGRLQEELSTERQRSQQMEAKMEKQLSEFDTEREQLRAKLGREEGESQSLRQQVEQLRTEQGEAQEAAAAQPAAATSTPPTPKALTSVSVATEPISSQTASCQTDLPPTELEGSRKTPLSIPVKPTPANYVGLSLPKTSGRGIVHSSSGGLTQTENGSEGQVPHGVPSGVSPRVQAARYKFQEQDQNGTASQSPPARDLSPTNRDNFAAKQQARHTVTQVLSRFTSPPVGGAGPLRPGLPHSASEGGPFPGRLSHPIGLKSPTVARIDRGNPPPIPPKKPGLSQTPSPPHPPIKVVGDSSRSPGAGLKPATPQLPPKPALDLVPALTASQVGACPPSQCPPVLSPAITVSSPSSINPPSTPSSISAPSSRSPCASAGSPLATASGWCPSVVSSLSGGGPAALDGGRPLLLQAASQGNNEPTHLDQDLHHYHNHNQTSALFAAAQNGHTECVKLLLFSGLPADASDENGFTSLHFAAAHGHSSCVQALLAAGAAVDVPAAEGGQTPLYLACEAGRLDCVRVLLSAGADRSCTTTVSLLWTAALLSMRRCAPVTWTRCASCSSTARLRVNPTLTSDPSGSLALPAALLNQANSDGWTAAHMAAALGLKECLEVLCSHSEQDIERRDKCNRTIHDVATDDCKDLLENLREWPCPCVCVCVCVSVCVCVRVEQYGNLIFHGLEGSCQEYVAGLVAHCIKVRPTSEHTGPRSPQHAAFEQSNAPSDPPVEEHFSKGSFLIATLSRPRLQGSELRLQQHFRWVTLRWDQEPMHGLLGRHLRRKLLHKVAQPPCSYSSRLVLWVSQVWQQLNACLSRLGTHEALLGPQLFLSCPVVPNNTQAVVRWLARLWNAVVVPRVEEAIISRVTAKRSSSTNSSPSSQSLQWSSPSNCGLSAGQQAVVKAALSILVNKAVLLGCPLPRHEIDRYLLEFRGGTIPLSAIGSFKGSGGGGGGRKGRDGSKLRRSNTSPRKKGSPALNWSCGGSFREGKMPEGLSVFSDDETDLIRELQTMCSSKSEPDISKVPAHSHTVDSDLNNVHLCCHFKCIHVFNGAHKKNNNIHFGGMRS